MSKVLSACVAASLLGAAAAQTPTLDNAGYGSFYRDVALDALTGNPLHLGVAVDGRDGHVFVSATGSGGAAPHLVYEFDGVGALLGSFRQPAVHDATPFGVRDLAFDGTSLIGGSEVGLSVFSTTGALVNSLAAANGPVPVAQPIAGPALAQLGVLRAVAFDPAGNGGAGALFVANFTSPILEIDAAGQVLASIPNPGLSIYGLAFDQGRGTLWASASPAGEIVELDRAGAPTGRTLPMVAAGAAPGGLSPASGTAGHHEPWASRLLLAHVAQGAAGADRLAIQRVDLHPGVDGAAEPRLLAGLQGGPLLRRDVTFAATDVVEFVVDPGGVAPAFAPCWTFVNVFLDANRDAYTDLSPFLPGGGTLAEWRTLSQFSVPATTSALLSPHVMTSVFQIVAPPTLPLPDGSLLRLQSLYVLPGSPPTFAATNELNLLVDNGERGIVVAASGPTSFQADPTRPFWNVSSDQTHVHGDILSVQLSFAGAAGPAGLMRFDLDQFGLGDRFDGGNSTAPGCAGTYRAGSDQLCGLDYGAAGVYVDPACHVRPGESGGFVATLVPGSAADADSVEFAFTSFRPGRAFAFDCDTDGGPASGDAHAGLLVRVVTSASGPLVGVLQVDTQQMDRSVVFFP